MDVIEIKNGRDDEHLDDEKQFGAHRLNDEGRRLWDERR